MYLALAAGDASNRVCGGRVGAEDPEMAFLETKGRDAFGSVSPSRSIELVRAYLIHRVNERVAALKASVAAGAGGAK